MLAQNQADGEAGPGVPERVMSGLLLVYGMETWAQRDGLPGGEVLILPLIILLIYLGWQLGAMWREVREQLR